MKRLARIKTKGNGVQTHVCVGLPSAGRACPLELVLAMSMQAWPANCGVGWSVVCGKPVADARNDIVEDALAMGAKYLWFVDDDTVPPADAARKLVYVLEQSALNGTKAMVASGVYCYKREPSEPLVFRELNGGPSWDWKVGDVFPVWGTGAGCMMIRTEVFERLKKPYFVMGAEANGAKWGEDLYFCDSVNAAGYRVLAHGGVLCRHWDLSAMRVYELPLDSYPVTAGVAAGQAEVA